MPCRYVKKATEGMDFPVPTSEKPDAEWVDDEARRAAQEKLDRKKQEEDLDAKMAAETDPRKRRLMQLRARMPVGARTVALRQVIVPNRTFSPKTSKIMKTFQTNPDSLPSN